MVFYLVLFHVFVISLSNYLVQYPIAFYGFVFTLGMFTYPLVCLCTDLTVRLSSNRMARLIVAYAYIPAIIISISLSNYRIGIASGMSYLLGQLLDIFVFQKIRDRVSYWWSAPLCSTVMTTILDTYLFFAIAFKGGENQFLAENWMKVASMDLIFKLLISLLIILPSYGLLLKRIQSHIIK